MWANAWKALDALGVADTLRANYFLLDGIRGFSNCSGVQKDIQLIKDRSGGSSMNCLESRCVERSALLETLAKALPDGSIRFNSKLVSIHKKGGSPFTTLELADGTSITAKVVIGCDGVNSVVAEWMGLEAAKPSGRVAIRGMGPLPQGHHTMEKKLILRVGKGLRIGLVPCTDKQAYWFITRKLQPQDADISRDPETLRCAALEAVRDTPGPIGEFIKSSPADTLNLAELKLRWFWPWEWQRKSKGKGSVTVVGDALHPMMPDVGQGASSALEDAVVLARCLSVLNLNFEDDWGEEKERMINECFGEYLASRKWRLFGVTGGSFMAGMVMDGYSSFLRFLREWVWLPFFSMSYITFFSASDCGSLPLQ
jgi:2-polyprenyl-6-methoxyphenol hydroxylase-like FAD-dependent oxidoreductase